MQAATQTRRKRTWCLCQRSATTLVAGELTTRVLTTRSSVCLAPSGLPRVFVFANYSDSLAPALLLQPLTLPAATAIIGIGWFAASDDELVQDHLQPQPPRHQRRRTVCDPVSLGRQVGGACHGPSHIGTPRRKRATSSVAAFACRQLSLIAPCPRSRCAPRRPFLLAVGIPSFFSFPFVLSPWLTPWLTPWLAPWLAVWRTVWLVVSPADAQPGSENGLSWAATQQQANVPPRAFSLDLPATAGWPTRRAFQRTLARPRRWRESHIPTLAKSRPIAHSTARPQFALSSPLQSQSRGENNNWVAHFETSEKSQFSRQPPRTKPGRDHRAPNDVGEG